jgi:tRNA dimethylallyltransferase
VTVLLALLGPTAAGKTRMSIEVTEALRERGVDCEIVSCDSMAVYRGLDVVADKPSAEDRARVPHHVLDVVGPDESFTVLEYRELARAAIDDLTARGAVPMLVGGSGLYFRGVVDELSFAPASPDVRARLEREDPEALYARLREADPERAEALDPRNVRRVVRAVEILELTGRPPSEVRTDWDRPGDRYDVTALALTWSRDELFARAEQRALAQVERGLLDEVRGTLRFSPTSKQALGVKEMRSVIEGHATPDDALRELVRNTKAFVRRQLSWFRADRRIEWIDASELGWEGARKRIVERFVSASS